MMVNKIKKYLTYLFVFAFIIFFFLYIFGFIPYNIFKYSKYFVYFIIFLFFLIGFIRNIKKPHNYFSKDVVSFVENIFVSFLIVLILLAFFWKIEIEIFNIWILTLEFLLIWIIVKINQKRTNENYRFVFTKWIKDILKILIPTIIASALIYSASEKPNDINLLIFIGFLMLIYFIYKKIK